MTPNPKLLRDEAEIAKETAIKEKAAAPNSPGAQTPATAKRNAVMADLAARHNATIGAANAEEKRKKAIPVRRNDSQPPRPPPQSQTPPPPPRPPPRPHATGEPGPYMPIGDPSQPYPVAKGDLMSKLSGMGASMGGDPAAFNAKAAEVRNMVGGSPPGMKRGGAVRNKPQTKFSSGGSVGSTSRRGDGIAQRGKTRGTMR